MFKRTIPHLFLALCLLASSVHADSLGETVNVSLGADGAAALAELPPELLRAVHASSTVLSARGQGLVDDESASLFISEQLETLSTLQAELIDLSREAFAVAMVVQARVVVVGARELLAALPEGPARHRLASASARFNRALEDTVDQRTEGEDDGPDAQCFQDFNRCLTHCSNFDSWMERTACGLDCGLDMAGCLGDQLGVGTAARGLRRVGGSLSGL